MLSHLQISKCWQTDQHTLVMQCRVFDDVAKRFDRSFVVLDIKQQSFGVSFLKQKPALNYAAGNFVELLRKEVTNKTITNILLDKSNDSVWFVFNSGHYIHMLNGKPPELQLIATINNEYVVIMRWGSAGTYTKKKQLDSSLPNFGDDNFEELEINITQLSESSKEQRSEQEELTLNNVQKDAIKKLKRKLKTVKKSLNTLINQLPTEDVLRGLNEESSFLKAYVHKVQKGDSELLISKQESGLDKDLVITLDAKLSVGQNMDKLFKQLKRAKKGRELGSARLDQLNKEIDLINDSILYIEQHQDISEIQLKDILAKHQIKHVRVEASRTLVVKEASPYRTFYTLVNDQKTPIFVGKGAQENDLLTKQAKSNDFWFHAVGGSGAHVVVPMDKKFKEELPQSVIKDACILALHYSQFKDEMKGEVYFTKKHYLKKTKDMAKGQWQVQSSKTIYTMYSKEELESIINRY